MELWEFRCCMKAWSDALLDRRNEQIRLAHETANFLNHAMAGKLRGLKEYLIRPENRQAAPKVSKEEFERRLKAARERRERGGAS
jgi:hypothetical protein